MNVFINWVYFILTCYFDLWFQKWNRQDMYENTGTGIKNQNANDK